MHEPVRKRHPMIDMEEFERRLRQSSGNQTDDDPPVELARLISGQQDSFQRFAEPQGQSSTVARQVATPSPEAQETEAQKPDALQNLDDDNMACHDSGTVNKEIASRLYIMIMATIIIVGMVGIGASFGYRNGASPPPETATISENGPAKPQLEKTSRSDVPTPDTSFLGAAPRPSPLTVAEGPADPLQPRETMPAAEIAASPEQLETHAEPSGQTAPIQPEKMNSASVERHDALISSDMPPRAKIVPLPVPRPAALAKAWTSKTAARVAMPRSGVGAEFRRDQSLPIAQTAKPKRPASIAPVRPVQATDRGTVMSNYGYSASANANPLGGLAAAITAPVAVAGAVTAPLITGRSVATGQIGNSCSTPAKTCELRHASYVGIGCSCHVPGGRARGSVTP
jgi:hypothetical protein